MTCDSKKCFMITWRIENYDFCQSTIRSPSFLIDTANDNSWFFELTPKSVLRKDHIALHVQRKAGDSFEFSLRASFFTDDSLPPLYEGYFGINPNTLFSSACYVPHSQIYEKKRDGSLPPKTLTIQCKICKINGSFSEEGRCFARTRMQVIKKAFIGSVENFSNLIPGERESFMIKSCSTEDDILAIYLLLGGATCCEEKVWIEISPILEGSLKYGMCELFLIDTRGTKTECGRTEIIYSETEQQIWKFPLYFTKEYLLRKNIQFLPNDTLTLKFEMSLSSGIEYEGIEDSEFGDLAFIGKNQFKFPNALEDLTSLYEKGILCDVMLQTETRLFAAHKIILSARSSVFRSMFTTDMKEKEADCVVIQDLDGDTVRRMLLYVYSDKLEDLDWESAKDLYFAADKYNIVSLTRKCSHFLVSCLEPSNCCELLQLADRHHDGDLMVKVQDFIARYREEIFRSKLWLKLEKNNPELSLKTLRAVYLEK